MDLLFSFWKCKRITGHDCSWVFYSPSNNNDAFFLKLTYGEILVFLMSLKHLC